MGDRTLMLREIWTIGHSNHELSDFVAMLTAQRIELLADVRRFPGSRRLPHFNGPALATALGEMGIEYVHLPRLGGRRTKRTPDSPNTAWRVEAFNAYADYMDSDEFAAGLDELVPAADHKATAVMCSEALPWRCHRRLIADALIVRGWTVHDIFSRSQVKPHSLTEFARIQSGRLTYPGQPLLPE